MLPTGLRAGFKVSAAGCCGGVTGQLRDVSECAVEVGAIGKTERDEFAQRGLQALDEVLRGKRNIIEQAIRRRTF